LADDQAGWHELSAARMGARLLREEAYEGKPNSFGVNYTHRLEDTLAHASLALRDIMRLATGSQVCDIFGNPFRPVALNPAWLTSTVLLLANGIYSERAFERSS
jgi:hypothetical protein